jgi:antitoxin component of MazEF toxin-antitoxin module
MINLKVKKFGGSRIIIIPYDVANLLNIERGTILNLELDKDVMIFRKVE